jgi:putative hydrolase of the HAD superfamily
MIKALILDLDDTIFPTNSINPLIVKPFFDCLEEFNDVLSEEEFQNAKNELWKRPFHIVAQDFGFSNNMINRSLEVLNSLEFSLDIQPFDDYKYLKNIELDKFLVTTGITKLQIAKIDGLKIKNDFKEIIIDDPTINGGGKTKVFSTIMQKYNFLPNELLIIGDNPESEIKAGIELGINTLLIERKKVPSGKNIICNFKEVLNLIRE